MNPEQSEKLATEAAANAALLAKNSYPGRGIVLGQNQAGEWVQVYWIMGRSDNSRNRIFVQDGADVKTQAADPAKLQDPSLIIYYPVRVRGAVHIVSNGDQTDTIMQQIEGKSLPSALAFQAALETRRYEPDPPNFTPRISGIMDLADASWAYRLSILKANRQVDGASQRNYFSYEVAFPGFGHCITTYQGDGQPLPTFAGEPQIMPLQENIESCAAYWWAKLNPENRISLLVKFIDPKNGQAKLKLINKFQ